MKPMKPCKAWAVVDKSGRPTKSMYGPPMLRQTRSDVTGYELYDDNDKRCARSVRVRVLDDAAVERAIETLKTATGELLDARDTTTSRDEYARLDALLDEIDAAIRDLGGKP